MCRGLRARILLRVRVRVHALRTHTYIIYGLARTKKGRLPALGGCLLLYFVAVNAVLAARYQAIRNIDKHATEKSIFRYAYRYKLFG